MNPDVWDPVVSRYYELAAAGGAVDVWISWIKPDDFGSGLGAFGRVEAFEDAGGVVKGLRGSLDKWPTVFQGKLEPMQVEIIHPGPQDAYAEVTIISTNEQKTLDDPLANPPWHAPPTVGWSVISQDWWQSYHEESIIISLVNVFEWRHLGPLWRGIREAEAEK